MSTPSAPRAGAGALDPGLLETLVNEVGDALFVVSPAMRVTFANRRGAEMAGVPLERLVGMRIDEVLDPIELRERPLRVLEEEVGKIVVAERTVRRADGTRIPVEISGRRLADGRLLAVARDVTERQQIHARMQVQSQALASAVSGIAISDLAGTLTFVNPAFLAMRGYPRETDVIGRQATAFWVSPDDAMEVVRTMQQRGTWSGMMRATRADGTTAPVDVVASMIVDQRGHPFGMMASFQDASERERHERHIAALARLYAVLSGVNQAIVRATSEPQLFEAICQVAVEAGGMRFAWIGLAEPDGRSVRAVAHAGHEAGYLSLKFSTNVDSTSGLGPTGRSLRDGTIVTTEDIAVDANMAPWRAAALERGYRSSAGAPFRRAGRVAGNLNLYSTQPGFFTEQERELLAEIGSAITFALDARDAAAARAALQDQLAQAQKMESIGRLAGGVAHDFNNMLSVILGHAELALGTLPADRVEREDLLQVREAARRSSDLTRQLLAFARRQPIAPRVLALEDAIAGSLKMLRRLIGEDITLSWRPGPELWPVVLDPSQLDQVLANLAVNARDAIGGVGTITIAAENTRVTPADRAVHPEAEPGEHVVVSVTDTGGGMDAETIAHAFEPFFTTKAEGHGTGLGLATVYGVAKQNGGFVTIESRVGVGTTVRVFLPRAAQAAARSEPGTLGDLPRGTEEILLVEDEASVRELTRRILERVGYRVHAAALPSEALQLVTERGLRPAIAVLDVVMPEMNGVALAERLTAAVAGLPCLFVSAYPADVVTSRGLLASSMRYLAKPFTAQQLARAVRDTIDGRPLTSG